MYREREGEMGEGHGCLSESKRGEISLLAVEEVCSTAEPGREHTELNCLL